MPLTKGAPSVESQGFAKGLPRVCQGFAKVDLHALEGQLQIFLWLYFCFFGLSDQNKNEKWRCAGTQNNDPTLLAAQPDSLFSLRFAVGVGWKRKTQNEKKKRWENASPPMLTAECWVYSQRFWKKIRFEKLGREPRSEKLWKFNEKKIRNFRNLKKI